MAFSELIREEVIKRNKVDIKGLGSFRLSHRKQGQQQFEDGRVVMVPPKDEIIFTPDKEVEV